MSEPLVPGPSFDRSKISGSPTPVMPAPTVPAEAVQNLVDQAACFNLMSFPDTSGSDSAILSTDGLIGVNVTEVLHRFDVTTHAPSANSPLRASNRVGEPFGRFSHRWMIVPDDFVASPGRVPPPTRLDATRAQRFVMLDGMCTFGNRADGFLGFGTGQTIPSIVNGQPSLSVTAIGTILEGFGRFDGHEQGTYVYCGSLNPAQGFTGNVLLRVMDPQKTLLGKGPLPAIQQGPGAEDRTTYIVLRGEAVPSDRVAPYSRKDGKPIGVIVEQGLRLQHLDSAVVGQRRVSASDRTGPWVGRITAYVTFNPASASGTALDPVPFTSYDEFVFLDRENRNIGSFTAESAEGRLFNTRLSGLPGIRFGGCGQIRDGAGPFRGIKGLMTDNSVVVFSPHVSASVYVLRIEDPDGRFCEALSGGDHPA